MEGESIISLPADLRPGSVLWLAPGLVFCYSPASHTASAIRAYYDAMHAAIAERPGRFVMISDTRHIRRMPDARMRRLHGALGAEFTRQTGGRCIYSITIIDSTVMRAMYSAMMWVLGRSAAPHEAVGSFEDAIRIARTKL